MKFLWLITLSFLLSGCGWGAGGADYYYSHTGANGSETKIKVHSVREVDAGVLVKISPDGTAIIETGALSSGANNLGRALDIADKLVTKVAVMP